MPWPLGNDNIVALREKRIKPSNRQRSSAGYTLSFVNGTIAKRSWIVSYDYLTATNKSDVQTFFDANQGISFSIDHPDPNVTESLTVVFDQDELEFMYKRVFPVEYSLEVTFTEV